MLQILTLLQYLAVIVPRVCKSGDSASLAGDGAGVARGVLCQLHPGNMNPRQLHHFSSTPDNTYNKTQENNTIWKKKFFRY